MPKCRDKRPLTKRFVVLCEGSTECHYVEGLKRWLKQEFPCSSIQIKPDEVGGGGYADIRDRLSKQPDSNCLAIIVLFDFDRYIEHPWEREVFKEILGLAQGSTKRRVPIILVLSNRDFEYALCCHDPKYRNGDTEQFLINDWKYESLEDCKGDEKVWEKAHAGERSHKVALSRLSSGQCVVRNDLNIDFKRLAKQVILNDVTFDADNQASRSSNISDLFDIVCGGAASE